MPSNCCSRFAASALNGAHKSAGIPSKRRSVSSSAARESSKTSDVSKQGLTFCRISLRHVFPQVLSQCQALLHRRRRVCEAVELFHEIVELRYICLLYTSPSPRDS